MKVIILDFADKKQRLHMAEDNARLRLAPPLTLFATLSYFPANRCALWENTHGTLLVPFLYQK